MDVLGLIFIHARYSKHMHERTGFGLKVCLSLHCLVWKFVYDEKFSGEEGEKNYTYTVKNIRHNFPQVINGGKIGAFYQVFESLGDRKIFSFIKEEFKNFTKKTKWYCGILNELPWWN